MNKLLAVMIAAVFAVSAGNALAASHAGGKMDDKKADESKADDKKADEQKGDRSHGGRRMGKNSGLGHHKQEQKGDEPKKQGN